MRIHPQSPASFPCCKLECLENGILRCVPPIPPGQTDFHKFMVEIAAIFQDHIRDNAPVAVHIDCADCDHSAERQVANELLGLGSERLAGLWAVDPIQADSLWATVV